MGEALRAAAPRLRASGSRSPRLDAELLLASGARRATAPSSSATRSARSGATRPRASRSCSCGAEAREPVAYILGRRAFRTIELEVTPAVLIPRPETETLVDVALEALAAMPHRAAPDPEDEPLALDVGTGSGCIALALAAEDPFVRLVADRRGRRRARRWRAATRRASASARRVEFVRQRPASPTCRRARRFDLIVSNPPYIPADEYEALEPNVRDYEPRLALYGGDDGLDVYRRLIPGAGARCCGPAARWRWRSAPGRRTPWRGMHRGRRRLRGAGSERADLAGVPRVVSRAAAAPRRGG